jgi:hypothetical protein
MPPGGKLLAFMIACSVAVLAAWQAPTLVAHWRADRTARQVADALYHADSTRLLRLSGMGSARNLLCARRLWPAEFWMRRDGSPLTPRRIRPYGGAYRYRTVGELLPGDQRPAVVEFHIRPARPTKVAIIFADARTGVWNDTVRACMGQVPMRGLIR